MHAVEIDAINSQLSTSVVKEASQLQDIASNCSSSSPDNLDRMVIDEDSNLIKSNSESEPV